MYAWLSAERCYNYNINSNNQDTTAFQTKVILTGIHALLGIKICCSDVRTPYKVNLLQCRIQKLGRNVFFSYWDVSLLDIVTKKI
jgi:hypothetical protein